MIQTAVILNMGSGSNPCPFCGVKIGDVLPMEERGGRYIYSKTHSMVHSLYPESVAVMWPDGYYHAIVKDNSMCQVAVSIGSELKLAYQGMFWNNDPDNGLLFYKDGNGYVFGHTQLQFLLPPVEQPKPTGCKHIVGRVYDDPRNRGKHWKLCSQVGFLYFKNVETGHIDSPRYTSLEAVDHHNPNDVENPNFV